jgi:hypothetical protein
VAKPANNAGKATPDDSSFAENPKVGAGDTANQSDGESERGDLVLSPLKRRAIIKKPARGFPGAGPMRVGYAP